MDINVPAVWDASPIRIPCTPNSRNEIADIMPITASSANFHPAVNARLPYVAIDGRFPCLTVVGDLVAL